MKKEIVNTIELLIEDMDIPSFRKVIKNNSNARWLLRNIKVRNSEHKHTETVIKLLKELV